MPIMVIEDAYNYYLTLFIYKLRKYKIVSKTFTTLYFSKIL